MTARGLGGPGQRQRERYYFHVLVETGAEPPDRYVMEDLSSNDLANLVVKPLQGNGGLRVKGRTLAAHDVAGIEIRRSSKPLWQLLSPSEKPVYWLLGQYANESWKWAAADRATDVTAQFLRRAPRLAPRRAGGRTNPTTVARARNAIEDAGQEDAAVLILLLLVTSSAEVLINLAADWVQTQLLGHTSPAVSILLILGGLTLCAYMYLRLKRRPARLPGKRLRFLFIPATLIALVSASIWLATRAGPTPPFTLYFVVDATDQIAPLYSDLPSEVQKAAGLMPPGTRIGLRIYGDNNAEGPDCPPNNSRLILPIHPYASPARVLRRHLEEITPGGHGSLTDSVYDAVNHDLSNIPGNATVFVLTSSTDPLCDPSGGGILPTIAEDVKRRNANIGLVITSIGRVNSQTQSVLKSYAASFGGQYSNTPLSSLPSVVTSYSNYGYGYP